MLKSLIVTTAISLFSINGFAQAYKDMMYDNNYNFYDVVDSAEAFFSTIDKTKKGSGYTPYLRWKHLNESRFAPSGDRSQLDPYFVAKAFIKFQKNTKKNRSLLSAWREVGPTTIDSITGHYAVGLGRIEDVYVHPSNMDIIYTGTRSGGFWKSTNGGASWQGKFTDTLFATGVNAIAVSPTNPDSILINVRNSDNGTSHGIYRSVNGGANWTLSNFSPSNLNAGGLGSNFQVYKIFYHPTVPNLIFIGTNQGLFRSVDNLNNWTKPYTTGQITQIAFHPNDPNIIYIYDNASGGANENKILISTNAGISFTPSATIANNSNSTIFISTTAAAPHHVYVGSNSGLWKSIDSGKNFVLKNQPGMSIRAIAVNTYDTSKLVAGYVDLSRSINGGDSFKQCTWWSLGSAEHNGTGNNSSAFDNSNVYVHADVNILNCINGVYFGGSDGYIVKSNDDGATWTRLAEGLGIRENYCIGTSQSNHYVSMLGSQDNGESIVNKNGWVEFYGADGMEGVVQPLNEDWIIGSVQYGNRRRTKDGGISQDNASAPASDGAWIAPLLLDPLQQMRLYDFTDSIFVSEDFGSTWLYRGKPTFNNNIAEAAIAYNNSKIIVVSAGSQIQKSIDAGVTWSSIKNNLPTKTYSSIAFDPNYDSTIAVTFDNFQNDNQKIYVSSNGGASWVNQTYNLGNMPLHCVVIDHTPQRNIYVGAEIGIYVKAMKDTVWQLYNDKLPNMTVNDIEICWGSNTLKAATWGRGLWENALLNRKDFPAIVRTTITNPPTEETPKANVDQFVTSDVHYTSGNITKMFVLYGIDTINLSNKIDMSFVGDSSWRTISALPKSTVGANIYFKVFAVGSNNDTTSTYRFMYKILPFEYCAAGGTYDGGNLHINNVTIANVNNTSINDTFSYNNTPIINLNKNTTYNISVAASTGWSENDYAAWIDFNGDKIFDNINERILYQPNNGGQASGTFVLPASYNASDTFRLRVRLGYWGSTPMPCGFALGEVEDYAVQMNYATGVITLIEDEIHVVPNPAQNKIVITQTNSFDNPIEIYDVFGKKHLAADAFGQNVITIDIKGLPTGSYIVRSGNYQTKFVKF